MGIKFGALTLSFVSAIVATDTLIPILYSSVPATDYLNFMAYLSLGVVIMSIMEIVVVLFDFMNPKGDIENLRLTTSTRTYEN